MLGSCCSKAVPENGVHQLRVLTRSSEAPKSEIHVSMAKQHTQPNTTVDHRNMDNKDSDNETEDIPYTKKHDQGLSRNVSAKICKAFSGCEKHGGRGSLAPRQHQSTAPRTRLKCEISPLCPELTTPVCHVAHTSCGQRRARRL